MRHNKHILVNLPDSLFSRVRHEANARGLSVTTTIRLLIRVGLLALEHPRHFGFSSIQLLPIYETAKKGILDVPICQMTPAEERAAHEKMELFRSND